MTWTTRTLTLAFVAISLVFLSAGGDGETSRPLPAGVSYYEPPPR